MTTEMDRLYTIIRACEEMKEINTNMSIHSMLTFFTVKLLEYEEGEATVKQISQRLKITSSAAGKLVKSHSKTTRYGISGSQLLKTMEHPANRQSTLVKFTPKGQKALHDLIFTTPVRDYSS